MSEVKIGTTLLQSMVSRAVRGAGNNKLLPITSLIAISASEGKLTLITTDATNTLYIDGKLDSKDDFYAVVPVDLFSKLIAKFTCETVELATDGQSLQVKGNGNYTLEMPVEEDGVVSYPDPLKTAVFDKGSVKINVTTLKRVYDTCSASVAVTLEEPCYTGYYITEKNCITTDTMKACGVSADLLKGDPVLLSPEMMSLVNVFTDAEVNVSKSGAYRLFSSETCRLFGPVMEGIEDYEIESISALLYDEKYPQSCKLTRAILMEVLDRIALFVSTYENRAVVLSFTADGLLVSNTKQSGTEKIAYMDSSKHKKFECTIDVQMLLTPLKAMSGDTIEVCFGLDNAIRIVDADVTQVVSLLQ